MIHFSKLYNRIHPAHLCLGDTFSHPNWEYTFALHIQLRRHNFQNSFSGNMFQRCLNAGIELLKHASETVASVPETRFFMYGLTTERYLKEVDIDSSATVRDPTRVVIRFSSGFNDDNGRHILGRTTFYHYQINDPSAEGLSTLIGLPSSLIPTRSGAEIRYPNFADVPEDIYHPERPSRPIVGYEEFHL